MPVRLAWVDVPLCGRSRCKPGDAATLGILRQPPGPWSVDQGTHADILETFLPSSTGKSRDKVGKIFGVSLQGRVAAGQ